MKRLILALAASLLPCASFAQVPMLTTPTPLKANSGDQAIKLSSARPPFKKGAVIKLCPVTSATPASSYVAKADACPMPEETPPVVTPPVVTPTPSTETTLIAGEYLATNADVSIGINDSGTLGTRLAAPAAFRDSRSTYARIGFVNRGSGSDFLVIGVTGDVFLIGYDVDGVSKRIVQGPQIGKVDMIGANDVAGVWTGQKDCIAVRQVSALDAAKLTLSVALRNVCDRPISRVRYVRYQDVDDGEVEYKVGLPTINKVVAPTAVQASLLGRSKGWTYTLSTSSPAARAFAYGFIVEDPYAPQFTAQPVGYTVKAADANIGLAFELGTIQVGAEVSLAVVLTARR